MNKIKFLFISVTLLISTCITAGGDNRDFGTIIAGTKTEARILACKAPEFSFHLPQMAGNFRLGISNGTKSLWTSDLKKTTLKNEKGKLTYRLKDALLANGQISVHVAGLSNTNGIIMEVEAENLPEGTQLIWSFGGCYGKELDNPANSKLEPPYCKYNVFSIEDTAFSVYYGESMRLRIIHGVTPSASDIRLSDAHQQESPLDFFQSGKKTDAPALGATISLKNSEKLYFCFYTQNKESDYNYYMLPELFKREFNRK